MMLLALAGCAGVRDVVRYEAGVTRVAVDVPLGDFPTGSPPDTDLVRKLSAGGFTTYLSQTGDGPVTEWYRPGLNRTQPVKIKSVSKTLVTAAYAVEVARGSLSWDTPLTRIDGCDVPPDLQPLTPAMLANMSAGIAFRENVTIDVYARPGWACSILSKPVEAPSGSRFRYSTAQTHLLGLLLAEQTGKPLDRVIQDNVLTPMGIALDGWLVNQDGDVMGGSEMLMHPVEMLALGTVFRDGGRSVVPAAFVRRTAQSVFADAGREGIGYGWGWWQTTLSGTPVHFAEGYGGQIVAIVPSSGAVHVFTAPTGGLVPGTRHDARVAAAFDIIRDSLAAQAEAAQSQ